MVTVAAAKRIRTLLQNQPERQKRQAARVELRKKIRDDGIALTERMDHERMTSLRADTPMTARVAADMGARPAPAPAPRPAAPAPRPAAPAPRPAAPAPRPAAPAPRAAASAPRAAAPAPRPAAPAPRAAASAPRAAPAPAPAPAPRPPPRARLGPGVRSRSPPHRFPPRPAPASSSSSSIGNPMSSGNLRPMSTGSMRPMSTGSNVHPRAAAYQIGTPRSVASTPSRPASSNSAFTANLSSRSPSAGGSVGSLIRRFNGMGHQGGAPPLRPARREMQLSRYNR
jgi:hypothetical protein